MPEPMSGTSNSGYKVRVADINDEKSVDCSEPFTLLPSEETPTVGEVDEPILVVTSPIDGDMAEACMEYTVEVCLLPFHLFWTSDYTFRLISGRTSRDHTGGRPDNRIFFFFPPPFFRGACHIFLSRDGFSRPFPSSTVKSNFA